MQPSVTSEIGRLRQVIIHRPGREMLRLTPSNMEHLLFDDMLWLEHAQAEHDDFANSLRAQGTEVLYFQDLLAEAMDIPEARQHVLTSVFTEESHGAAIADAMRSYGESLTGAQLAELLIAGMTKEDSAGIYLFRCLRRNGADFLYRCPASEPPVHSRYFMLGVRRCLDQLNA